MMHPQELCGGLLHRHAHSEWRCGAILPEAAKMIKQIEAAMKGKLADGGEAMPAKGYSDSFITFVS
ncbi:hypothetical protein CEJ86_21915 [Sinorhizobium meliloti]|uniref:Uncharacterized protein n=1 Tax=Rhizobium meliloti TaxID=382 RepID=A0A2J0YZ03_RHIML|nr:hypothetical protein CEJ86_21915 [Sinorhizobium meliloti]